MNRKATLTTLLIAALAATALLAAPTANAVPGWGNYDCSQNRDIINNSRFINAHMTRVWTFYDQYATGIAEDALDDMAAAAGDFQAVNGIAAVAEHYIGVATHDAHDYISHIRSSEIAPIFKTCPRVYARNIAFNNSMHRRISNRQAELRDALNGALALYEN